MKTVEMNIRNAKIDRLLDHAKAWKEEMKELREIILDFDLTEEIKWRLPCYSTQEGNIVIIQSFKNYCAIMFFKGALLKDSKKILLPPGNSQAARQIRFTNIDEIHKLRTSIRAYIKEAIKIEKDGLKVNLKKTEDFEVPVEFKEKMDKSAKLKTAFYALTPGRQRAYLYYFSAAKQSSTREQRVKKSIPLILIGKGLND